MNYVICDTTVLDSLLGVPGKCQGRQEVEGAYELHVECGDRLFLPLAAVLECGNHIAQCVGPRRALAEKLVFMVKEAIAGNSPFQTIRYWSKESLNDVLANFVDNVTYGKGIGMGDSSILEDCRCLCRMIHDANAVVLWSYDEDLVNKFSSQKELWSKS